MARLPAKTMAAPDLGALRWFSKLPDREASPYFGGRTEEMALVEGALSRIRERGQTGHRRPAVGESVLFQGAPGAGKSALLHHLVQRWRDGGHEAPLVVDTEASHYVDERVLALQIAEAFDPALAMQLRRSVTSPSSAIKSLSGGKPRVATGAGTAESDHHTATDEPTLANVARAFSGSRRTVVLILDEAQDLEGFDTDLTRQVIAKLHKGSHGGSFLTIFAGLAHSDEVLKNCSISRFSRGHDRTLSALPFDDAVDIVRLMLAECRIRGDEEIMRRWAQILAKESCGWPQHLHVSLQALAAQLLAASEPGRLEDVDSEFGIAVLNASAQAREEYYERRIDASLAGAWQLLAETLRRTDKAAPRDAVLGYIRAGARLHEGSKSLPKEYDAERFLDHMIRRGVLQRASGHMLVCPIPSFRDYIERIARNTQPET